MNESDYVWRTVRSFQKRNVRPLLLFFFLFLSLLFFPYFIWNLINFFFSFFLFFQILLCTCKEDATWVGINAAVDKLGFIKETANTIEKALVLFQNMYHHIIVIDVRSRNFDGEKLCKYVEFNLLTCLHQSYFSLHADLQKDDVSLCKNRVSVNNMFKN